MSGSNVGDMWGHGSGFAYREAMMGKTRSGSIRERTTTYTARVAFLDEAGQRQKIERQADTQKQAGAQLKEILQELSSRKAIKITSQKTHERRGGIFARVT